MTDLEDRLRHVLMTEGRDIVDTCNNYEEYADELLGLIMREVRNQTVSVDDD